MKRKFVLGLLAAASVSAFWLIDSRAQTPDEPREVGKIVDLLPGDRVQSLRTDTTLLNDTDGQVQAFDVNLGSRWIGVVCGPVPDVLRAHVDLDEEVGIAIQQVIPDSPAEASGLKEHDIIVSIAGKPAKSTRILVQSIGSLEDGESLGLEWLRKGKLISATVQPTDRPQSYAWQVQPQKSMDKDANTEAILRWLGEMDGDWIGHSPRLRIIGPGVMSGGGGSAAMLDEFQGEFSIQITKQDDQPSKIIVNRNGDSWEVNEHNLHELPEDIRVRVEPMLRGAPAVGGLNIDKLQLQGMPWPRVKDQLRDMELRMQKMQDQLKKMHENAFPEIDGETNDFVPKDDASLPNSTADYVV